MFYRSIRRQSQISFILLKGQRRYLYLSDYAETKNLRHWSTCECQSTIGAWRRCCLCNCCCGFIQFSWQITIFWLYLPLKVKRSMCTVDQLQATSFSLGEILQKWAGNLFSFITYGIIYYIKHVQIQLFSTRVDWSEIVCSMEVYTMLYKYTYCIFTLYGRM